MKHSKRPLFSAIVFAASLSTLLAQTAPSLGPASSFAVLAHETIPSTAPTVITGKIMNILPLPAQDGCIWQTFRSCCSEFAKFNSKRRS